MIYLLHTDITTLKVGVIVNAANSSLLGGGGVDGAIHRAGGLSILDECRNIRAERYPEGLPTGQAVYTKAGRLPSNFVIHTVGPIWSGGDAGEQEYLKSCYENCMKIGEDLSQESIAFPNISTGVYGYPKDQAALIAIRAVTQFPVKSIEHIIFVCYDSENYSLYDRILQKMHLPFEKEAPKEEYFS
ncbi:O-acetyl-ADP-ribose deacetylase [Leptospira perolatii]|uniref:O-acetyl-ADP-ribose deacetylase n=1 Tax=Leptospira perolatii TaxID=2023191 RepID=A0A2M9ZJF3_9LEPT|nr:O-acetyl-ADP-ribose deacetylase [Leptospira perolatii]PJZ68859.1 O-acetyl-ADP-ribose deacetylase [Leptospira perolatii]PJZ72190.1 O-acetyl-ADP-ribose deacetylase [Leptospira perolatii]